MNTLTIQVEDKSVMAGLKKVLKSMNGVVILPTKKKGKTGMEEAIEDVKLGRVTKYKDSDEMFKKLGI